jgi:methionyl-tRNA formyltransferase
MESAFSVAPLQALLSAGHDVRCVVRPIGGIETRRTDVCRRHRGFDLALAQLLGQAPSKTNPFAVAHAHNIPAYLVGDASSDAVVALMAEFNIELIVVAFFNQLLRSRLLDRVPRGAINLHPSLLPAYRGPAPLFWQFYDAADTGGLTVHRISVREDDGDILAQRLVPVPVGVAGEDWIDTLADVSKSLVVEAMHGLVAGRALPQGPSTTARAGRPAAVDGELNLEWPVERLYRFARGVGRWHPLTVVVGDERIRVLDALRFDPSTTFGFTSARVNDELWLQTESGSVAFVVRS